MTKSYALPLSKIHFVSTKTVFFVTLAALLSTFIFYVYLVNKTVMNVVARQQVERAISEHSTSLGALEFKYIGLKNAVTLELAYAKGFTDATPVSFIARENTNTALSYNSSR
ncbi:MAG: hypothetical protein K0S38_738 [Candidatus Paceibacter sp.]|jgi:hypothetical protein|nr:hypothetical protein [Candidatus Paceibacter sp.]